MTQSIQSVLFQAQEKLQSAVENARLEADLLLAHVLNQPRHFLYCEPAYLVSTSELEQFNHDIARRLQGEPIAYITGAKEFWSLPLSVSPDTLIPRPETELLVEHALSLFDHATPIQVADLGTGSGAIALALAHQCPAWQVMATDQSEKALHVASKNAHNLGINNISFYHGNWCTALPRKKVDMVISNPPYIALNEWEAYAKGLAYEPREALIAGEDGLADIKRISDEARYYLKPNGYLLIEHGFQQGAMVREILMQDGYKNVHTVRDLNGCERVTIGSVASEHNFLV